MRFTNFKQTRTVRPSRLGAYLLRRRADAGATTPGDRPGSLCFGPVDETDQLALEAFVAGEEPSPDGQPVQRPDRGPTDPPE